MAACNTQSPSPHAASPSPVVAPLASAADKPTPAAPPVAVAPARYGVPITSTNRVTLAQVVEDPARYKGETIVTTGTVSAVCQEQGCWMAITDAAGHANVRFHGHSFFVPRSSKGKQARVEGTLMLVKDGKECDEMSATGAELHMDATGVELM